MIGVYQDNYGGDIEFQFGIEMKKFTVEWKHQKVKDGYKIMMC